VGAFTVNMHPCVYVSVCAWEGQWGGPGEVRSVLVPRFLQCDCGGTRLTASVEIVCC